VGWKDCSRRPYRYGNKLPFQVPGNIRSDNGVPFASAHALFHLSKLAV
jgi:hypothetical protein